MDKAAAPAAAAAGTAAQAHQNNLATLRQALDELTAEVQVLTDAHEANAPPPPAAPVDPIGTNNAAARPNVRFGTFGNEPEEDFLVFRHHIDQVIRLNQYNDEQARLALASAMKGRAAAAVLDIDPLGQGMTYPFLMGAYEARFLPAASSQMSRMKFDAARQGAHEDVLDFHARLRTLYNKAYPNARDDVILIRRFSIGLRKKDVRSQVMRGNPTTYAQALDIAQNETSVLQMVRVSELGPAALGVEPMEIGALSPEAKAKLKCFYCHRTGHIKAECRTMKKDKEQGRFQEGGRPQGNPGPRQQRNFPRKDQVLAALQPLFEDNEKGSGEHAAASKNEDF